MNGDKNVCNICNKHLFYNDINVEYKNKNICIECSENIFSKMVEEICWIPPLLFLKGLEYKYFYRYKKKRISLPEYLRKFVLEKYKFICQDCGLKINLTIDHIKPVKYGGDDSIQNLTILCKSCNSKKGSKWIK
jgi:hypothetical protein